MATCRERLGHFRKKSGAVHALNLGSLWFGLTLAGEEKIKALLDVPERVQLVTAIALGYSAGQPLPPVRLPVNEVTYREKWSEKL